MPANLQQQVDMLAARVEQLEQAMAEMAQFVMDSRLAALSPARRGEVMAAARRIRRERGLPKGQEGQIMRELLAKPGTAHTTTMEQ